MAGQGTKVTSGARLVFFFNSQPVGYAAGVNWSEEIMYEPIETLDHLEVREHVPVGYRVTLSADIFRTVAQGPSTKDSPGSLKEQGIMPKFDDILTTEGVPAVLFDKVPNKAIAQFQNVKTSSQGGNAQARGVVRQNVSFVTTRMLDESEISAALQQ